MAQLAGAQPGEVVFTSGGSEANNLAIKGSLANRPVARLTISAIEHACLMAPANELASNGWQLDILPVSSQGQLDLNGLELFLQADTQLISVMAANNETGAIQDVKAVVNRSRSINKAILCHSDACQMFGKSPISFAESGLDMMSLSSHKLYGPQGAGALLVSGHIDLKPQICGGGQERNRRSGTENLAAIVGFGAAAQLAGETMQQRQQHTAALQQQLLQQLLGLEGVEVFAQQAEKLPNTLQFSVSGIDGEMLLMQLDKKGFAVSSGSACDSGKTEPSHVLLAMGADRETARGAIRVSFGEQNTR